VNNFTASYGDVDLNTVASNEGTSVPSILMNGDGSSSSPYEIRTASDLQAMQEDLDADYKLIRDIDASGTVNWNNGQGFNPIGDNDVNFTGSFDGQNHTISNLSINRLDDNDVGLFEAIGADGEVKNVGVINVNITGNNMVGGLVGINQGTVSNSYSTGNVTGKYDVGGLVGYNDEGSTISNSYSTGNVTGGDNYVGGLVGYNDEGSTISNSYSTGNVTGESYSTGNVTGESYYVGGLVGINHGTVSNSNSTGNVQGIGIVGGLVGENDEGSTISNSYSTGNVTGESYDVGGLVGRDFKGNISNSYSTGNVTGGDNNVGGLVGRTFGNISNSYSTGNVTGGGKYVGGLAGYHFFGTVSNSYWDTEATGQSSSDGGNGLTTSEMQGSSASSNMSGFDDFTDTWSTVEGDYPELKWQE
jgi:hypothetical protein